MHSLAVSFRTYERVTKSWTKGHDLNAAGGSTDLDSSTPLIAFLGVGKDGGSPFAMPLWNSRDGGVMKTGAMTSNTNQARLHGQKLP